MYYAGSVCVMHIMQKLSCAVPLVCRHSFEGQRYTKVLTYENSRYIFLCFMERICAAKDVLLCCAW